MQMEQTLAVTAPALTRERGTFADDVRRGLSATPKFLLPQYFYDALGSALFSAICELPEYYVARAEHEILRGKATEIAAAFGSRIRLAELGSGSACKTRHLIESILARQPSLEFFPVDVDAGILASSAGELQREYPGLSVTPIRGDFREPATLLRPHLPASDHRTIVLFLG